MSEILFLRHAETDMAGTFCGHSDPHLNVRGQLQVAELVDRLRTEKIRAVYTSDLHRAHATGIAIAEAFRVPCHMRAALREINFGNWEGLTWEEIERRDKDYSCRWVAHYPNLPAQGGENFPDFEARVLKEVNLLSIEAESIGGDIAVVTHAGVLRTVLRTLHGCSDEEAWKQTASYCCLIRHNIGNILSTRLTGVTS